MGRKAAGDDDDSPSQSAQQCQASEDKKEEEGKCPDYADDHCGQKRIVTAHPVSELFFFLFCAGHSLLPHIYFEEKSVGYRVSNARVLRGYIPPFFPVFSCGNSFAPSWAKQEIDFHALGAVIEILNLSAGSFVWRRRDRNFFVCALGRHALF